jgi:hypothetical protein
MPQPTSDQKPFNERRSLHLLATTQRTLWPLVAALHRGISYPLLAEAPNPCSWASRVGVPLEGKLKPTQDQPADRYSSARHQRLRVEAQAACAGHRPAPARPDCPSRRRPSVRPPSQSGQGSPATSTSAVVRCRCRAGAQGGGSRSNRSCSPFRTRDRAARRVAAPGVVTIDGQDRVHLNLEMLATARTRPAPSTSARISRSCRRHRRGPHRRAARFPRALRFACRLSEESVAGSRSWRVRRACARSGGPPPGTGLEARTPKTPRRAHASTSGTSRCARPRRSARTARQLRLPDA